MLTRSQKMIKKRRELLSVYLRTEANQWRRIYPETFYTFDSLIGIKELEYIDHIYEIFMSVIDGYRKTLIEDEINLMYMDMEIRGSAGNFMQEVISAIRNRVDLKKKALQEVKTLAEDAEYRFADIIKNPPKIRFRLESTVYLVRLLAYGLFSNNEIVLERVAEVFDIDKLQSAVKLKDRRDMDETLKFLYRGLIQKNERGRQGSRHAARQTLTTLRQWFPDNEYVIMCIEKIQKYV